LTVSRVQLVVAGLLVAAPLLAQQPHVEATLRQSGAGPPDAVVRIADLLADDRLVPAMRAGFPLYVALTVELRESRALWDRSVDRWVWEYVVQFDPVRDVYVLEDPDGTEEIPDRDVLARRLGRVYVVGLRAPEGGRYHYRASVTARMLSDVDVDEVYAWLRGDEADTTRRRPGLLTRTARKLLVQVAPLPRVSLQGRTADFEGM
jgi:hypothetical protein